MTRRDSCLEPQYPTGGLSKIELLLKIHPVWCKRAPPKIRSPLAPGVKNMPLVYGAPRGRQWGKTGGEKKPTPKAGKKWAGKKTNPGISKVTPKIFSPPKAPGGQPQKKSPGLNPGPEEFPLKKNA